MRELKKIIIKYYLYPLYIIRMYFYIYTNIASLILHSYHISLCYCNSQTHVSLQIFSSSPSSLLLKIDVRETYYFYKKQRAKSIYIFLSIIKLPE